MPRRKNQSPGGSILERDSTVKVSQNSDVQLKWRDTTLRELQSMFSGSVDPEVVQLVLSESNYNVNDAVEKLFVLSGIESGEKGSKTSQGSDQSPSPVSATLDSRSTKSPKPNQHNKMSSHDQSDLVADSCFTESHSGNPAVTSNPSTFGNLPAKGSYEETLKVEINPLLHCNTTGIQYRTDIQRTEPSVVLPSSSINGIIPRGDSTSPVLSSGIPDFPDNVLQQFRTLKNETKGASNGEKFFCQEPAGHRNLLYNTHAKPPVVNKVPGNFEFGRPPDVNMHDGDPELRGNLESLLKKMISGTASTEKWKAASHDSNSNTEKQQVAFELSKKGSQNQHTSVAHSSDNKRQLPYDKSLRTSDSDTTNQTNYQNLTFPSPSQKVQKTGPHHNVKKPHLQQKENKVHQPPYQRTFHASPEGLMFRPPPPIQRQIQPFPVPQAFSQTLPRNAPQQRFAVMPTTQSPWQQKSVMQRPMTAGHVPYHHPQGTFAFQPQFPFGRVPTAAVRPAFGSAVPFIQTVHQKLLILVRGLPGSGKSSLAQRLKGTHGVVLSTDDYFYRNQRYDFDVSLLGEAHEWNQRRAKSALENNRSPVIIDNTNTQAWEMKPYVSMALKYGYHIKFVEPDTTWKWNVKELARRNQHGVNITAITKMKERFEHGMTVEKIINPERKFDAGKTGSESENRMITGTDNQNHSPKSQSSSTEKSPQELVTRRAENYGVTCGEKMTLKVAVSEKISSSQVMEDQNSSEAKKEEFNGLRNSSEKCVNLDEKSVSDSKTEVREEKSTHSAVSELDIGKLEEGTDVGVTKEYDSNSCPKPQRVQRSRDRRTPNKQQRTSAEVPALSTELEYHGNLSSSDNHDKLDLHDMPSQENASEERSPVNRVETLSKLASLANNSTVSPIVSSGENVTDCPVVTESADVMKSPVSPFSDNPLTENNSPVLNASSVVSDGDAEVKIDSSEEPITGKITCDVESSKRKTSVPLTHTLEDDVTDDFADSGSDVVRHAEASEGNSVPAPPPLSTILASASRTKLKRRARSNSDTTQPITDSENSPEGNALKLLQEPNQAAGGLEPNESLQSVSNDDSTQESKTSDEDGSPDAQNQPNLSDLSPSSSGDSQSDMSAQVEFLKTCFPDVHSDLMNALLNTNGGDVMKVVDELLSSGNAKENTAESTEVTEENASSTELSGFSNSPPLVAQNTPFNASNEEEKSPPPEETGKAGGFNQQSPGSCKRGEISSDTPPQENRGSRPRDSDPRPLTQAQSSSPSSAATFQLTLEPAVALHLIEMFGSFAGVDFQDDISHEDLIIDVDNSLAKQLYKKWEKSIQMKKGISAVKRGSSERAKVEPTGYDAIQLSRAKRSPQRSRNEPQAGNLREIMDEQLALELSRNVPDANTQDIATKLKRQKLYEMYPGVDPVALEEVFQANRYELAPSVEAVKASCNLHGREVPNTVIASGFNGLAVTQEDAKRKEAEEDWSWLYLDAASSRPRSDEASFQTLEEPSYLDYRAEAFQHCKQRDECFKKAALAFSKKQGQLAQFYAQQGHLHTEKIKEANARAAALILDQQNESTDNNTIDLHGLHVTEAIEALERMLAERTDPRGGQSRKGCKSISVVTGRGNHSRGGKARIKPAILEYLKQHNYRFMEPHPGLVKVFL